MVAEGKGGEGLRKNAALLGLDTSGKDRPKMKFGSQKTDTQR